MQAIPQPYLGSSTSLTMTPGVYSSKAVSGVYWHPLTTDITLTVTAFAHESGKLHPFPCENRVIGSALQ